MILVIEDLNSHLKIKTRLVDSVTIGQLKEILKNLKVEWSTGEKQDIKISIEINDMILSQHAPIIANILK